MHIIKVHIFTSYSIHINYNTYRKTSYYNVTITELSIIILIDLHTTVVGMYSVHHGKTKHPISIILVRETKRTGQFELKY